jgi:hypothetical protein
VNAVEVRQDRRMTALCLTSAPEKRRVSASGFSAIDTDSRIACFGSTALVYMGKGNYRNLWLAKFCKGN